MASRTRQAENRLGAAGATAGPAAAGANVPHRSNPRDPASQAALSSACGARGATVVVPEIAVSANPKVTETFASMGRGECVAEHVAVHCRRCHPK